MTATGAGTPPVDPNQHAGTPPRHLPGVEREAMSMTNEPAATQHNEGAIDVVRILLAILLPPVGVFLQVGLGLHFWLNILLTLLGYIPGIIHAVYIILTR
jgi:uncharacterized membrane protein YqaE (UPF0057 family)